MATRPTDGVINRSPGVKHASANISTSATVLIGLIGAFLLFNWTAKEQQQHAKEKFDELSLQVAISLGRQIGRSEDSLTSVTAFFSGSKHVGRDEFRVFVSRAVSGHVGVQALEWIPKVPDADRAIYEDKARKEGLKDFSFRQIGDGGLVAASRRGAYFPVYYIEPMAGNQRAVGFDLASNPVRKAALEQARDTGQMVSSARITLVQETAKQSGILVFAPIYSEGLPIRTVDERRRALAGFALGVFRIGDLLEASIPESMLGEDFVIALYDASDADNLSPLHHIGIDDGNRVPNRGDIADDHHFEQELSFGGRQWHLVVTPKNGKLPIEQSWVPWLLVAVVLFIMSLIGVYIQLIMRRREYAEILVNERTRELDFQKLALDEHAIVSITDTRGDIIYANDKFCDISGYARDEIIGQNHRILRSSEHTPEFYDDLWRTIAAGKTWQGEIKNLQKGGGYYWVKATIVPFLNELGKPFQYVAIRTDITERKKAEETLHETTDRLLNSQQIAHVGSWDWDIVGGGLEWTDEIFNIFGRSRDDFDSTYEHFLECIYPDDRDEVVAAVGAAVESDVPYDLEHRILHPDGSIRYVHEMGRVYRDEDGSPVRMLGIVHDTTERTILDRAKNEFVSTVSHELRTPLTSIKGSLGLIKSGNIGELPDKLMSMLNIAYNNSDRLVLLINDILDMEKIEAGKMDFNMCPMIVASLLAEAIEANKGYADEHDVTFKCIDCDEDLQVNGDRDRLMQALANIMSNAAKFSGEGGQVELSLKRHDGMVRIAVRDYGEGIPEAFRDTIFDKFTQADSSDTRQSGGTGLGLSITRLIAERHNGNVCFDTEIGEGTTFYIDLPELRVATRVSQPKVKGQSRILICEDENDIATLLEMMLTEAGYSTRTARTAAQARQMLAQGDCDAMTLDLNLPDQDGISLIHELRSQPETQSLPIIVVSASASDGKQQMNGDAIGIIDWIQKPIDRTRLVERLADALRARSGSKPRILHVEDDESIIQVVTSLVDETADIIPAMTVGEARTILEQDTFDLVILDLTLPDGDGSELLPLLSNADGPSTPVVIF